MALASNRFTQMAAAFALATFSTASAIAADESAAFAAELYEDNCSSCHLDTGAGDADTQAPMIAGFEAAYLQRQIDNFRNGRRVFTEDEGMVLTMVDVLAELLGDEIAQMLEMAVAIKSQADVELLANYVAGLE